MNRGNKVFIFFTIILLITVGILQAQEKPRIGVLRFSCMVDDMLWWRASVASDLQDMLTRGMEESLLTKGPHAKAFEAVKTDRSDIYEKLGGIHFVPQNKNKLADVFKGMEGFSAVIGVTLTGYNITTGDITATIMFFNVDRNITSFLSSRGQVKSSTKDNLIKLTASIAEKLTEFMLL